MQTHEIDKNAGSKNKRQNKNAAIKQIQWEKKIRRNTTTQNAENQTIKEIRWVQYVM